MLELDQVENVGCNRCKSLRMFVKVNKGSRTQMPRMTDGTHKYDIIDTLR